jgi:hypothetical protein
MPQRSTQQQQQQRAVAQLQLLSMLQEAVLQELARQQVTLVKRTGEGAA